MKQEYLPLVEKLCQNVSRVFLGKSDVVEYAVVAMLASEHILLEDVPGVGKTLLGKAVAKSVSGRFDRIQFTPDLLPSDITGSSIFDTKAQEFVFQPGPVFTNILLADEINRTTPRTQSALLEAMGEHQVSSDSQTHLLPQPFMVIATQNPLEFEGTYPLPESQLDRFLMRISIGYPDRESEMELLNSHRQGEPVDSLEPVLSCQQVVQLQKATREVRVDETINRYILDIVHATRDNDDLHVGVSTRGALALYRAAQATAILAGRDYVVPDDVKKLVMPVLSHRVVTKGYLHGGQREAVEAMIEQLVDEIDIRE